MSGRLSFTVLRVFMSKILRSILGIAGLYVFVTILGATQFGIFVLIQASVRMISIVTDMGIQGAVEKRLSEGTNEHILGTALVLTGGLLLVVSAGLLLLRGYVNAFIGTRVVLLIIPLLVVEQLGQVLNRALRGELSVGRVETALAGRTALFFIFGITLVIDGRGLDGLLLSWFLSWVVFNGWALTELTTTIRRPTRSAVRSIYAFSKYNFVVSVAGTRIFSWMDTVIIGLFLTPGAVTAYEVAWRITGMVMLLSRSIGRSIFPQFSNWDANSNQQSIEEVIPKAITGGLLLVVPSFVGSSLLGADLLSIVFGQSVAAASVALTILMLGRLAQVVNTVFGSVLLGMDRPDLAARAVTVFVVLNVGLNVVLVQYLQLNGVAIATTVSFAVNTLLSGYYASRLIEIDVDFVVTGTIVLAAGIMGGVVLLVQMVVPVDSLPALLALVGSGGLVYFVILAMSPPLRHEVTAALS